MCGIVALAASKKRVRHDASQNREAVRRAMGALDRRGPDGEGLWSSPRGDVVLGHTRLAIVDLAGGAQPMANEDGSCVLVFNGELYGHAEIRADLEQRGHRFRSRCDAEIIVHLYEEHGATTEMLAHLRGEFAFVLWDETKRRLFAARDRFGIKPLVYAEHDGGLYLGSRAKALFDAGVPARWNEASLFQAASLQYTLPDETLFDRVRVLPPGHFLLTEPDRDDEPRVYTYWDQDYPPAASEGGAPAHAIEQASEAVRAALEDAVRVRLDADVPVAFQLSGGIDSSAVLALAAHCAPDRERDAFTISFTDAERYDERALAIEMAAKVSARHHVIEVSSAQLLDALPRAIADGEGLAVNAHIAAKHILSRKVREAGFKVVLTGEGADEVLAGYAHLRADLAHGAVSSTLQATNTVSSGLMLPHDGDALDTSAVLRALGFVPTWLRAKANLGARLHGLMSTDAQVEHARVDPFDRMLSRMNIDEQLRGRGRVEQASYLWSKLALEGYILRTLGDGMEMAHSIEGRLPFLDHRFFEVVRSLPTQFKITGLEAGGRPMVEKAVLRLAVGPLLTEALRTRQKHPFLAPPLLTTSAAGSVREHVSGASLPRFFDQRKVSALFDRLPSMTEDERIAVEPALMMLFSASILHTTYRL